MRDSQLAGWPVKPEHRPPSGSQSIEVAAAAAAQVEAQILSRAEQI
jgi:hypothetical protein